MTFVGKIHVRQEDPPILTRCILDSPGEFYGLELTASGSRRVTYEDDDRSYFYDLPPWVSLARSWDDLDRFLREFNEYLLSPSRPNRDRSYVSQPCMHSVGSKTHHG